MSQLRSREPEGDDERQVEQQFKRSRDPVRFVRVAPAHPTDVMVERSGAGRSSVHRCVRDEATNQEAEVADFLLRFIDRILRRPSS